MAEEEPCGSNTEQKLLQNYENVTDFTQVLPNGWPSNYIHLLTINSISVNWTVNNIIGLQWSRFVGWLCWGLTSQSTISQSCRDGAIASWVINQYFRGVKCLAQGHNTATVGLEPRTSRSGVRHSTTEPPRSPHDLWVTGYMVIHLIQV